MTRFYKERVVPFKICKVCGVDYRPVTKHRQSFGLCIVHYKEFKKAWYAEHREQCRAQGLKYYRLNREQILTKQAKFYAEHPEYHRRVARESARRQAQINGKKNRAKRFLKPSKYANMVF